MSKKWLIVIFVSLGVLFVGGCTMPTPCSVSDIGIPGNLTPSNYALVSLSPSLTWEYPSSIPSPYPYPAGTADCEISGYQVFLVSYTNLYTDIGGNVPGPAAASFTPGSPLEPATLYYWQVRAKSSAGNGPWSGKRAFWTGPLCSPATLTTPYAIKPLGTVSTLRPKFQWVGGHPYGTLPGACMPSGYHFELSTDPAFGSTIASLDRSIALPEMHWQPDSDLQDCTNYYWRVAAKSDTSSGPYVNASFRTQVGACPLSLMFIPRIDANCRIGPNPLYDRLAILTRGEGLPVEARHQTSNEMWYKLRLPNDLLCWASEVTGDFVGDPEGPPYSDDFPALPQPKPGGGEPPSCSGLSQVECDATPGCSYSIRTKSCVAN